MENGIPVSLAVGWLVTILVMFGSVILAVARHGNAEVVKRLERQAADHTERIGELALGYARIEVKQDTAIGEIRSLKGMLERHVEADLARDVARRDGPLVMLSPTLLDPPLSGSYRKASSATRSRSASGAAASRVSSGSHS